MEPRTFSAVCLLFCGLFVAPAYGQGCTFPSDINGLYDYSHETSQMTINSTHVYPLWVDTQSFLFSNLTFECNFVSGTQYILRSSEYISIYTVPYYVYTCWEFLQQSTDKYVVYQATTKLATAADKNYKIYPIAFGVTDTMICDVSKPYTGDTVSILLKNGTASTEQSNCPTAMWAQYVYRLTDTSSTNYCYFNSFLDICTSTSAPSINTTLCSTTTLYSTGGQLYCMYYMQDTSSTDTIYVYLYNDDTTVDYSTNYRFTCVMLYTGSTETYMTQYPSECLASTSQNGTYIATSPGGLYTMYANVTCPPTSEATSYLAIIIACVVILLLIIIGAIIGGCYYYKKVYLPRKRDGRSSSKVSPDTLPNTAMSGMTADKNYRMMFTPAPPKSAVPGRRAGGAGSGHEADSGSRAVSAASLRPTVSALATYRTPSPFITDGKDIDVDSLLDFDYSTKQNLGDPDGAESGVMLEMEGSLPVYSEPGDTPEPTCMTPPGNGRQRLDSY